MKSTKSHTERIYNYLANGNRLTQMQAIKRFGCLRLGARIHDLRQQGYKIQTHTVKRNGKTFGSYELSA